MALVTRPRFAALLAVSMLAIGCGGTGTSTTDPPSTSSGNIFVGATSPSLDLTAGQSSAVGVQSVGLSGYNGPISLTLENAPTGVAGSFSPASVASGNLSSILTVTTTASTVAGSYSLRIRANGSGGLSVSFVLVLTVRAPATGSFSVSMDPPRLSIARGVIDTATIRIARTSFTSPVALLVSGAPAGVTATIVPASASLDTALLILAVSGTAAPGVHSLTITGNAPTRTATFELTVPAASAATQWAQISASTRIAGNQTVCAVTVAGVGYCWGASDMMGNGTPGGIPYGRPTPISGEVTWTDIQLGARHACGISTSGDAYCWGDGSQGELGNGGTNRVPVPGLVSGGRKWRQISPGDGYTCGVTTAGDMYCWGRPTGVGGSVQTTPLSLPGGRSWQSVSAADPEACGITTSGEQYCWRGFVGTAAPPALAAGGLQWRAVEMEWRYRCGLTTTGAAMCTGGGGSGELGNGSYLNRTDWTAVAGGRTWTLLTGGTSLALGAHTCGITPIGEGFCWGAGTQGQLGNGGTSSQAAPVPISGGFVWSRLTVGGEGNTCGITVTREAYCWGYPGPQLGNGTPLQYFIPTRVIEP